MFFFFSSRRRHTRFKCDWSSDVCSSDLEGAFLEPVVTVTLGNLGPGAVPALVQALGDPDVRVRRGTAYALGVMAAPAREAGAALTDALRDREARIRASAAGALDKIGPDARQA